MALPPPSPVYTLRGAGGPLNTLHFSCHGGDTPLLFSGSGKGAIHVWNLNSRRPERIIEAHSGNSVIWVSTLQSSDTFISQGRDMRICLWDLSEGRSEPVDAVWTGSVGFCQGSVLETSPPNYLLACAGEQTEEIKIIELPSKTPVCTLLPEAKLGMVMCIKLWQPDSAPGPLLLAGYEDGSLLLWDVSQRSVLSQVKAHTEAIMCLTFDTKRLKGISGSSEKKLSSWMLDGQNNLQGYEYLAYIFHMQLVNGSCPEQEQADKFSQHPLLYKLKDCVMLVNPGVSQLCIRDDGKLLASAGWDQRVRIFGWKKLQPLAVLQYHTDMVLSVAFSNHRDSKQRLLAAGSKDQRISLWSIYNQGADQS